MSFWTTGPATLWRGLLSMLFLVIALGAAKAEETTKQNIVARLCSSAAAEQLNGVSDLLLAVEANDVEPAWGLTILDAISRRALICEGPEAVVITSKEMLSAISLAPASHAPEIKTGALVNLRMRGKVDAGLALLRLLVDTGGPGAMRDAEELGKRVQMVPITLIERAANLATNSALAEKLRDLVASGALQDGDPAKKLTAIATLAASPSSHNLSLLLEAQKNLTTENAEIQKALASAISQIRLWLEIGQISQLAFSGLSYASILFMAAMGLAVIFGLMGVINLAQGELIMIGAYVTFLVQEALKLLAPGLVGYYLLIAIPFAFLVTGGVGVAMEVTVIRHLYKRPLTTLLATWAISLLLINLVRVLFGTQNLEFVTPVFLSGGVHIFADFFVTWNRLFAIAFAFIVLCAALVVLRFTRLGMFIRAVTENRTMASCIGVSVRFVDMVAFGLGAGLAGLAGLALSPIYTVNPGMGTGFIVDAFMIVVLGGVGSLVGTAVAALSIGMINVIIEPVYGAVAAKVIALLIIVVFIQFRPEGMIAQKGRR
ncbi:MULTISPECIES: urea ABC transporter permease subunit UrtB [Rhizobium/Agrobacterium group]|uniref:urea ABC transporter permease subunit UrtB n=1 Tax=Rhizobium/Agrobacterium group TaxID=227290 RepID=UPI000DD416FB|nr:MULTISPECIES: urea ABC transporter permease subunit UrtB [unclassified Rhizobium]